MSTIKEKEFHKVQKYIASKEWKAIKAECDKRIEEDRDFIIADATIPQDIVYSRNMLRGKQKELAQEFIGKIKNQHIQKLLDSCIVKDVEIRMCIATEKSEDILEFSHKDWIRRERATLQYISDLDRVYGQEEESEDNKAEDGQNSLDSGVSI